MSLFYDRTRNISGASELTGFAFDPNYGSTASFSAKLGQTNFTDKIANIVPLGLNLVVGEFSLNFQLRKDDAKNLINFYENQSGTGIIPLVDNSNIYKTLSGTISSLGSIESNNNDKFDINLGFSVERNSSVLNWSGQSFVNHQFVNWNTGINFDAYDIVYFENDLEEPCNNFFYCTSDHESSFSNCPLSTGNVWTKDLFLSNNELFSFQQTPFVAVNDFNSSFKERVNDQKNIHSFDRIDVPYKNISDKKTKALLHFAESHLGHKRFKYVHPQIYDKPKIFFSPSWEHQWNYKDSNNFKLSLIEDPLGILPSGKPSLYLLQESGRSSLSFSITGNDRMFFDTGNGKELLTGINNSFSWPNTNVRRELNIWGRFVGFTGSGQGLVKSVFSSNRDLTHLNLGGNSLSSLNLSDLTGLNSLICADNNIGGLDAGGKGSLTYIDYSNNAGSYLNIGGSANLTGLYAVGNSIPAMYLDTSLAALSSGSQYSGVVNFSGNSGVSTTSLSYVSDLTGRGWFVGYNYTPPPAVTPDFVPTGSASPSWPAAYGHTVAVGGTSFDACSLIENISCDGNNPVFVSCSVFNLPENTISGYSVGSQFSIQNGGSVFLVQKLCCDIASVVSGPISCAGLTSASASVGGVSNSNSIGSVTVGSNSALSFSPSDGWGSSSA